MAAFTWKDERVAELIDLYQDRPCLYNVKSKDYFNRDLRKKALEEIAKAIGTTGKWKCL